MPLSPGLVIWLAARGQDAVHPSAFEVGTTATGMSRIGWRECLRWCQTRRLPLPSWVSRKPASVVADFPFEVLRSNPPARERASNAPHPCERRRRQPPRGLHSLSAPGCPKTTRKTTEESRSAITARRAPPRAVSPHRSSRRAGEASEGRPTSVHPARVTGRSAVQTRARGTWQAKRSDAAFLA